ncbi:hypothetical protein IZ6_25020 [Terrihabitans soli]|uniref:Uncharacterized protein n=1 Tax=Terrihabitans soli TaxID=708113 RepID=A0A6S6QV20_9HYPH|nr:hypothetical protein [Terrihabitans soli]BCJ91767.1 hypothetical protein IZ6_25020 [Terrihabitans soli]
MTRLRLGKNSVGDFKAQILKTGANPNDPAFGDILFDSDYPNMRVYETGHVTLAWATGTSFSPSAGQTVIDTVDRPFVPICLSMAWRPYVEGNVDLTALWGIGPYNRFGGGTNSARPTMMRTLPISHRGICPNVYDDGVLQQIRGYRLRVYSNQLIVNNYFRSGGPRNVESVTTCENIGGGQTLCTTARFDYYGSNPHASYSGNQIKLTYHLLELL